MRRNLVIVRAGDASLHPGWLAAGERNFDIFVSYYGKTTDQFKDGAEHYESVQGLKWPRMAALFKERGSLLASYDACWFPDDDVSTDTATVNRMFDLFHEFGLWLAQPALGKGSHPSFHRVTNAVAGARLRFTDFVEVMCPLFDRRTLSVLAPTFGESVSGWGLDYLWPHLLGYPRDRIAILDETPVVHTRPGGSGSFYLVCAGMNVKPGDELWRIIFAHRVFRLRRRRVYQTIPAHTKGSLIL